MIYYLCKIVKNRLNACMTGNKVILIPVVSSLIFSFCYIANRIPESKIVEFFYALAVATIAAGILYIFQVFMMVSGFQCDGVRLSMLQSFINVKIWLKRLQH
jgi:hypothetical protein